MSVVNLSKMPGRNKEYVIDFNRLDGGLNTWELDYRLGVNESPKMKNLWWKDGAMCCRDGQIRLTVNKDRGRGWSVYETLFHGFAIFHAGDRLYAALLDDPDAGAETIGPLPLLDGVPQNRGSWFRYSHYKYGDCLYYKNRGGYYRIGWEEESETFTVDPVEPYTPIIQINTDPTTAAGDAYQPENRLSPQKTVEYSTVKGVKEYHLPVQEIDSVDRVTVDGERWYEEGDDDAPEGAKFYKVDLSAGTVTFVTAEPTHHEPVQVNTVDITYTKANEKAYSSIMDSPHAIAFGGNQELCVVVGGCDGQPNAYFWSGNHVAMDPGYFPVEQYNLAGAAEEYITGFGKQQGMLVIFKESSVGRAAMSTQEMLSGRVLITMDYVNINSRIGCDMPWSIQLVENNLVFANTEQGVHRVADSSSAYENNIVAISRKVDNGLLELLRKAGSVTSFDDGSRYWLVADGEVYAWDYSLSTWKDPSWFYFEGIPAVAFLRTQDDVWYHVDGTGQLTVFRRSFSDYGKPIDKLYQFATQYMGSYDRLKDVVGAIFVVRGDTDADIAIEYTTDYESRFDRTPIRASSWHLVPRNLAFRDLRVRRFANVARRRPGCRHVRHFTMTLTNDTLGTDMCIVSAQLFYKLQGRDR